MQSYGGVYYDNRFVRVTQVNLVGNDGNCNFYLGLLVVLYTCLFSRQVNLLSDH